MTVTEVLRQAKALSPAERKQLLDSLTDLISMEENKPKRSLFELRGVGKEIWKGIDAQAYVNEMRDEWDRPR